MKAKFEEGTKVKGVVNGVKSSRKVKKNKDGAEVLRFGQEGITRNLDKCSFCRLQWMEVKLKWIKREEKR